MEDYREKLEARMKRQEERRRRNDAKVARRKYVELAREALKQEDTVSDVDDPVVIAVSPEEVQLTLVRDSVEVGVQQKACSNVAGVGDSVAITVPERVRDVTVIGKQVAVGGPHHD